MEPRPSCRKTSSTPRARAEAGTRRSKKSRWPAAVAVPVSRLMVMMTAERSAWQRGRDPAGGLLEQRQEAAHEILPARPAGMGADVHGGERAARAAPDRRGDGAQALLELLVDGRVALTGHLG